MTIDSKNLASWLAIFSLIFSSVLTIAHNHGESCDCSDQSHVHAAPLQIAGLENLPKGDCDCDGCEIPQQQQSDHQPTEHDEDGCSICRMVYESGEESTEFELPTANETVCDTVYLAVVAPYQGLVSEYLTRGPPAFFA